MSIFVLRRAFTLIELLVVIAIVAILAAILFPVFAQAKNAAKKGVCVSNQRQITAGFLLYQSDHDDGFPNNGDPYLWAGKRWRWPVMSYIGAGQKQGADFGAEGKNPSLFLCPADILAGSAFDATSYAYSAALYHTPEQVGAMRIRNLIASLYTPGPGAVTATQTASTVASPCAKVLLTEWYNSHDFGAGGRIGFWGTLQPGLVPGGDRWQGSRALAFVDGHVSYLKARRITPSAEDCPDIGLTPGGAGGEDVK
jgi:prepilin-type N-terminal cleavage/methylation domain-containing protein